MFIDAIKHRLRRKDEDLTRLQEIEAQAQRFEQHVLEAMQSIADEEEETDQPED
ncbi:MAG: hypothetical protein OEZ68_09280 [Gammaproteobacteria bacterium]|nr:hypothetical protein [Gammaproteobacteria bacterium]MDH5800980.1 hypothetical protein [Gammaproteobacteria bacterium]